MDGVGRPEAFRSTRVAFLTFFSPPVRTVLPPPPLLCLSRLLSRSSSRFVAGSASRKLALSYLVDPASSICLSQRLSHACLSTHGRYSETANGSLNQLWFLWSLAPLSYLDNCGNSRANTCRRAHPSPLRTVAVGDARIYQFSKPTR